MLQKERRGWRTPDVLVCDIAAEFWSVLCVETLQKHGIRGWNCAVVICMGPGDIKVTDMTPPWPNYPEMRQMGP
jgi:hypothetical protein